MLRIVGQHLANLLFKEHYHLVEAVGEGVVGADVEAARKVVEGHGAYTGDEDTLDRRIGSRLDCIEKRTQVTRSAILPQNLMAMRALI